MSKKVPCPSCFHLDALLENEKALPNTPEYIGSIYCPSCESGENDVSIPCPELKKARRELAKRSLSPEDAYFKDMEQGHLFDMIEIRTGLTKNIAFCNVISGLCNDAMLDREGWERNIFFFLKGLEIGGVITRECVYSCIKLFIKCDENTFRKYENIC